MKIIICKTWPNVIDGSYRNWPRDPYNNGLRWSRGAGSHGYQYSRNSRFECSYAFAARSGREREPVSMAFASIRTGR